MRLVLGRCGSGKTTFCMNEIKKFDSEAFSKPLLYIVPEQFSFEAEKELIRILSKNGMINTQVISFRRLAYKLFSEKGLKDNSIGNSGKAMLIYSIMIKHENELLVLKNVSKNVGLLDTVINQIEEFKRYRITPDILENFKTNNEFLKMKLSDICLIFKEYEKAISDKYNDGNDELNILINLLSSPTSIDGAKIWIDGFDGFIPQEIEIIKSLEKKCDVTVSLINGDDSLFDLNQTTINKLSKIASIDERIILNENKKHLSKELCHLENNFLRFPYETYNDEVNDIVLTVNKNPYSEIEYIAGSINNYVKSGKYRYKDIAVVLRDESSYKESIRTIFRNYDIPFFMDDKRELSSQPIVTLITSFLDICIHNFSYESMFSYLKTLFTNINDRDDIDILENYVLKWGIRGNDWQKEWQIEDENLEKINYIRELVVRPIISFKDNLSSRKTTKDIVESLYNFLIEIDAYNNIQNQIDVFKNDGNYELASEYAQVWNIIINIFDEMVQTIGNDVISFERFSNILKIGISNHKVGIIPPCSDQVIIGDIERSRSGKIKILFIIGLNDGIYPKAFTSEGFINDSERKILFDNGIEIAKDTKKLLIEENFNIYKAFCIPSEILHLSYSIANYEGKALRASFIIQQIKNIFTKIKENSILEDDMQNSISKLSTLPHLLNNIRRFIDSGSIDDFWKDIYIWYINNDSEKFNSICSALNYKNTIEYINQNLSKKLYGNNINASVSKLEKYSNCPFSFYLRYGLNANERAVYRLENPDLGSFLHEIIDRFSKYLVENDISWRDIDKNQSDKIIDIIVDDSLKNFKHNLLNSSTRLKQLTVKLKRLVKRMIWIISMQIKSGEFNIVGNEVEFGVDKEYSAICIKLSDGSNLVLNGKIDRIDIANTSDGNYLRIIDYKSSSKQIKLSDVYYGVQLQLITYLDAVANDSLIPGGVLYLELNDPIIKSNKDLLPEEIEREIIKQLRMKGLVLADAKLIKAMDSNMQKESDVLNLSIKNDGSYSKMPTATEDQIANLRKYIRFVLKQIGEEIINGNIKNEPAKRKNKTPCDYCEYKLICQFDKKLGNSFKTLKELSDEEVYERIR